MNSLPCRLIILGILIINTLFTIATPSALAAEKLVKINLTSAPGRGGEIGTIKLEDSEYGLLITPEVSRLSPGIHGFHVHTNPNCAAAQQEGKLVPGLAAGGHYDPNNTGIHLGPYKNGHLGDLPPLFVEPTGQATTPILAPRLQVKNIEKRSLIIHAGGDNFADQPLPLGGGGARVACGIID